jgi:TolB-like protein
MERVWPDTVVEESNLTTQIAALRRLLDLNREGKSCIQTIPGRGYRFVPIVRRMPAMATTPRLALDLSGPLPEHAAAPRPAGARSPASRYRRLAPPVGLAAVVLSICLGVLFARQAATPVNVPPRLSLAVLPLQNLSEDKSDDYLATGITEDLRSDLSHIPGSTVVGTISANRYKAPRESPDRIGHDLNVRYLIEGSIRRIGAIIRVNAQLVATDNATTLWSDRFDEDFAALAAGQDRIVGRLRAGLGISLVDIESMRSLRERPTTPDVFDLVLQARALLNQPPSDERSNQALTLYERALALDPDSIHAVTGIALIHINRAMDQGR